MFEVIGDPVIYWLFRFATFFTLLLCGYLVSYRDEDGSNFWGFSLPALIVYSLNYGLRWNRSFDYPHYYSDLVNDKLWADYDEPLYLAWIDFFKWTGLPYWTAFIFYSAILLFGFMLIVKKYPQTAVWAYPLFLILPSNVDNFVRQYFAIAFFFIGFYFMQEDKLKRCFFFFACAVMIHLSAIFAIVVVLFFQYFDLVMYIKTPWVIIVPYILLYFFWDVSYLGPLGDYLMQFEAGETRLTGYLQHADIWFTEEGDINTKLGITGIGAFSALSSFIHLIISIGVIYFGFYLATFEFSYSILYWATVIALFIRLLGGSVEIYSRFVCWLIVFEPIMIGLILTELEIAKSWKYSYLAVIIFYYYGIQLAWQITKISMTGYAFIWDK